MTVSFPPLCVKSRVLSLGQFSTTKNDEPAGTSTVRLFGDKSFLPTLEVDFGLLKDSDAAEVWEAWTKAGGSTRDLYLPPEIWEGIGTELLAEIPDYIAWHFSEEPTIESAMPGYSRISVKFIGLDGGVKVQAFGVISGNGSAVSGNTSTYTVDILGPIGRNYTYSWTANNGAAIDTPTDKTVGVTFSAPGQPTVLTAIVTVDGETYVVEKPVSVVVTEFYPETA
jgi:hypothetical protein